ncbi:hypothetical protein, partial [Fusobacterium nucleatum]
MRKVKNNQPFDLYLYALITLIASDIFVLIFLIDTLFSEPILYIPLIILLILIYFITRAIANCLKYYLSQEECYCENSIFIYKRILFKKFLLKKIEIPLMNIKKIEDKGFAPSYNMSSSYLNPLHYIVIFFNHYERILLELKTGIKYNIYVYTFPYGRSGQVDAYKDIYNDNDFLRSFAELKEMIEEEQKKILFNQTVKNLIEKYNSPLEERYNYILNKIIDEEKLFISEKDNNFIINGDSEAIKD